MLIDCSTRDVVAQQIQEILLDDAEETISPIEGSDELIALDPSLSDGQQS